MDHAAYLREKVRSQCNFIDKNRVMDAGLHTMIVRKRAETTYISPASTPAGELSIPRCELSRTSYSSSYVKPIKPADRSCSCFFNPLGTAGKIEICCCPLRNLVSLFNITSFSADGTLNFYNNLGTPIQYAPRYSSNRLQICNYDTVPLPPASPIPLASASYYFRKANITRFRTIFNITFNNVQENGVAFVIQNQSLNALGSTGNGLGYVGITPGVAFAMKTNSGGNAYQLSTQLVSTLTTVSVGSSGVLNTPLNLTNTGSPGFGGPWNLKVEIVYDGTTMSYVITNNNDPTKSYAASETLNLRTIFDSETAWIGFTGGVSDISSQDAFITSWQFLNDELA